MDLKDDDQTYEEMIAQYGASDNIYDKESEADIDSLEDVPEIDIDLTNLAVSLPEGGQGVGGQGRRGGGRQSMIGKHLEWTDKIN